MKQLTLIGLLFLVACHSNDKALVKSASTKTVNSGKVFIPKKVHGIEGFYYNDFKPLPGGGGVYTLPRKITLCIDSVIGNTIYGRSIVEGKIRPFKGDYEATGNSFEVTAPEPGTDPNDGIFRFSINKSDHTIDGDWTPNNKSEKRVVRNYQLESRSFRYDPDIALPEDISSTALYDPSIKEDKQELITADALKKNASSTLLKKEDIENMYAADLEVLRNSIFARHGYAFKNTRMRLVFEESVPWYLPVAADVTGELTEIEKKNIALLKRYEKHAGKYYEDFGR